MVGLPGGRQSARASGRQAKRQPVRRSLSRVAHWRADLRRKARQALDSGWSGAGLGQPSVQTRVKPPRALAWGAARPHRAVSNAGGQSRPLRRRSGPDGSDDDAGWPRAFESRGEDSAGRDGVEHRHPARLVKVPPARGHMRAGWPRKRSSPQHPPMAGKGTWQASITFLGASQLTADQARGPAIGRQPAGASARSFSSSESRR